MSGSNESDIGDFIDHMDGIYPDVIRNYVRGSEESPFFNLTEGEFKARFRFSKIVVRDEILPITAPNTRENDLRGLPISALATTLIALRFYATGNMQIVNGDLLEVSQPTVSRIVRAVSKNIVSHLGSYVKFPSASSGINELKTKFYRIGNFPGVVGCIDCTHIPIKSPGGNHAEEFRNRKGWMSLNVQAACGPNLEILDIVIRWPGSAHDSRIFNSSALKVRLEQDTPNVPRIKGILLGDAGYAQTDYVYTPVPDPVVTVSGRKYNRSQIKTRNTIERCFGVWKRRFSCISKKLNTKLSTTTRIIAACAVLHNIAIQYNDLWEDDDNNVINLQPETTPLNSDRRGRDIRNDFIHRHFS